MGYNLSSVKDTIPFTDFAKLDLRVGKVITAENIEGSQKLLRLKIDLGSEYGQRQILAGLAQWYKPLNLEGKKFIFVVNLEVKKMMGEESQGMMLAVCPDEGKPQLLSVNKKIPQGSVVR